MNQYERDDQPGCNEVNRACGLASAEEIDPSGEQRIDARRHRESHQDHQRQQNEDDDEIGELLQNVVARGRYALLVAKQQVILDRLADSGPLVARRQKIAGQMPAP